MNTELTSMVAKLNEDLTTNLHNKLTSLQIPISTKHNEEDDDFSITIFVALDQTKISKKYSKSKNYRPPINILYTEVLDFDYKSNLQNILTPVKLIWNILKVEYYSDVLGKISSWSTTLFKATHSYFKQQFSNMDLVLIPYQVYLGKDCTNIHINKLPEFTDLRFCNAKHPHHIINPSEFLQQQAIGIIEASKAIAEYQESVKKSES